MKTTGLNLLIPDKPDVERDAVATAFETGGGAVHRIARFWDPPIFEPSLSAYTVRMHFVWCYNKSLVSSCVLQVTTCS